MAQESNYMGGLEFLLGKSQAQNTGQYKSPEQDIKDTYDEAMQKPEEDTNIVSGLDDIVSSTNIRNLDQRPETGFDRIMQGRAAQQMGDARNQFADQTQYGEGQIMDPNAVIGSYGQQAARGIAAGWGDLVSGTGDTIDWLSAWVNPQEADPTTSVGSWLKKTGEKYQNDNVVVLSEDLKDMNFGDLFDPEFYTSKISRLLPYALSFIVPYTGGAALGTRLLGRFGGYALKTQRSTKTFGRMGKFGQKGRGPIGATYFNKGKGGVELTKGAKMASSIIGGGIAANIAEGSFISGEAYNEMINEVGEDGNPLFAPADAANIASGVLRDNTRWMLVDIVSNGMLFGGLGRNTLVRKLAGKMPEPVPFTKSAAGLMNFAGSKISNHLPAAGVMWGLEGLEEGLQEVYQEWIKYTNIQEGKGLDHKPMTEWLRDDEGNYRSDIRDIFWSSVGLGGLMGGTRGYFDSVAERTRLYNEKAANLNDNFNRLKAAKTPEEIYEAEMYIQDNIIAEQIWNYSGDGSGLKSYVQTQVEEGKMPQETADQYIEAIEEAEKNYEKHSVNTGLTEAGAKQAFFRETRIQRNAKQQQEEKDYFAEVKRKKSEIVKDKDKLNQALEDEQAEHDAVMEVLQNEEAKLKQELEFIYTRKKDDAPTAKSTGKRDKRYKTKGMSKDEFDLYTQEGAQEKERIDKGDWTKQEREQKLHTLSGSKLSFEKWKAEVEEKNGSGFLDQFDNKFVNKALKKDKGVIDTITDFAKKTVKNVTGLFGKAKETATSEETKKAIEEIKKYTKEKITPSAKAKLITALEAGKIVAKKALEIVGTGVNKVINNTDVKEAVEKFKRGKKETEEKEETIDTEYEDVTEQEDVKKKDKSKVAPKTEKYSKLEESIKKLGKALKVGLSAVQKERGYNTYSLLSSKGTRIKFFSHDNSAEKYMDTMHDIELHLLEPFKGGKNVVEVDGKLYLKYPTGPNVLYESVIEVRVGDTVIGQISYRDYNIPLKKAKKTNTINRIKESIKGAKARLQNHISNTFDNNVKQSDFKFENYLDYYTHSGFGPAALTQSIVSKKFPGKRGFVVSTQLLDDFGQEATALAIGGAIMINEDSYRQGDIIHELGHIYYHMHQGTPLMKRINKLLYKTSLYDRTKREYPELILMNYGGENLTIGQIYNIIKNDMNHNEDIQSDILSIVLELNKAEGKNPTRMNELFNSLRVQLKSAGNKEIRSDRQTYLLEETFTRTLEAYSGNTIESIIDGSAAQEKLRADLKQFYKETKNLVTEEEAEKLLNLSDKNINNLDLEAAIKHVLLDFNSGNRKIKNSSNGVIRRANKVRKMTGYSLVYSYLGDVINKKLSPEAMAEEVASKMKSDHMLSDEDTNQIKKYIEVIATQTKSLKAIQDADSIMDTLLSKIGYTKKNDKDFLETEADKYSEEERIVALPKTAPNFLKKVREIYNNKNTIPLNLKNLQYQLYDISKNTMYDPYEFIPLLRNSEEHDVKAMLEVLDNDVFKGKSALTDAKLMELKGVFEGINVETYGHAVLMKWGEDENHYWSQERTISSSLENNAIQDIKESVKDNNEIAQEVISIYKNLFKKDPKNIIARQEAAEDVLKALLSKSGKAGLIDVKKLVSTPILYKGKQQFLRDILFDHKQVTRTMYGKTWTNIELDNYALLQKSGKWVVETKKIKSNLFKGGQSLLKSIITEGLVLSRPKNYLSMVDNVEQDGISIFNKENGMHNRVKNLINLTKDADTMDKNSIIHRSKNIFTEILIAKRQTGKLNEYNPFGITVQQGLMRSLMNTLERNKDASLGITLSNVEPSELMASDFFGFLSRLNEGVKRGDKVIMYNQPIAVFSDKGRRYYIEAPAAYDKKSSNILLKRIKNNPAYNGKYLNGEKVFPFTISADSKGNYYIEDLNKEVKKFKKYMSENPDLYKGNRDYNKMRGNTDKTLSMFLTSYIANRFMAQQAFIHDHRQSENEVDYVKRAAGAIASHTVFDRNIKVEPIIFKDYFVNKEGKITTEDTKNTAIQNDAMGYILPEQAEAITNKYGSVQKVGSVFKFVYHYTEVDNPKLKGKTTYLKFAVHVLTPDIENKSPELKKIGDILRARHKHISESTINGFNEDISIFNHGNLIIAASESAAKLFKDFDNVRSNDHIYDILGDVDVDNINKKQDELYFEGGLEDEIRKYHGLSGEGLGIQLELDKESSERFYPSQLFYNLATNISGAESEIVQRMYQLRKEVMEENNKNRNKGLALKEDLTEQDVMTEEESFKSSISPEVFGVLVESVYGNLDPRYPLLNPVHNSVANGRIVNQGTKMFTKGSIAYQSSDLGMGLKSYQKVSDYFEDGIFKGDLDTDKQRQFGLKLAQLSNENPNTLVSEAYVPGYLKDQGVEIGDLFIGTRVPAHGKVSSTVFIVKDFHKKIKNTPSSNITIPAWVSKYWGADLDGDAIHMNFKYSDLETKGKKNAWRLKSNTFFDLYVELISKTDKSNEIKADIDFKDPAESALEPFEKKEKISQLTPWGDAQMFEDNVPAKHLVGMVAALQRSFNILSKNKESLPLKIKINNNDHVNGKEIGNMFDDSSLEGDSGGNWYGVAQLLNIVLDNAKHQYASKLGLNKNTVFPYVLLRRLGYSLNDLALIFNSPVVKEYIDFKKSRSKTYISKYGDVQEVYYSKGNNSFSVFVEFLKAKGINLTKINKKGNIIHNQAKWNRIRDRIEGGLDIEVAKLYDNNKKITDTELDTLLMIYTLEQWNNDVVKPFSKAFTVHQNIEKNPLELKVIRDNIKNISENTIILGGQLNIEYDLGDTKNNPIVTHAVDLFDSMLNRSTRTDIRFTPYMQSILSTENAIERLNDQQSDRNRPKLKGIKQQIINQVIYNDIVSRLKVIVGTTSPELLVEDLQQMKKDYPDNLLVNKVLELRKRKNGTTAISINNVEINDLTSLRKIKEIQESFNELDEDAQNTLLLIEQEINKFGFTGTSIAPFFNQETIDKINRGIATIIEENQTKQAEKTGLLTSELEQAITTVLLQKDKKSLREQVKESGRKERTIRKAKKVINAKDSMNHNSDLKENNELLGFSDWSMDIGIDLSKIDSNSNTYSELQHRYAEYMADYELAGQLKEKILRTGLSNIKFEELIDIVEDLREMDQTATKHLSSILETEIGQRMFQEQAEFLKDKAKSQKFEYNIPGVDGAPQEDISNYRKWMGANNMTSKRPEMQYLINEAEKQYLEYIKTFKKWKNAINPSHQALIRSKRRSLNLIERATKSLNVNDKYRFIYGNITVESEGKYRLKTSEEIEEIWDNLSEEEKDYYTNYRAVVQALTGDEGAMFRGLPMQELETLGKSGLFGLYNMNIDDHDYHGVKVYGTDKDGKQKLKTFHEWKVYVYQNRSKGFMAAGKDIMELGSLRKKAKQYKALNMHEDRTPILLSDNEMDVLIQHGKRFSEIWGRGGDMSEIDKEVAEEYIRRKKEGMFYFTGDIHTSLLEFTRAKLFKDGEAFEGGFTGMSNVAILTDAAIAFNKKLDNPNASEYLTKWWKESFIEKKTQESIFGKRADKIIDGFVRLTSLRLLGFNLSVGIGNLLAGKYQELRKRGGKQFVKGEERFWKHWSKSKDILKKHRVIEYSFDEFVHLSTPKGLWGKVEKASFVFMDQTEHYIQGSAFLGMLTKEEWNNPDLITEERAREINHKISTLHGEGYTALDQRMLSMYSWGRSLMQFKKWFVTLFADRLQKEHINRFGEVEVGSYRAAGAYVNELFRKFNKGELSLEAIVKEYRDSSPKRQEEMRNYLRGVSLGLTLMALIALAEGDEDEQYGLAVKYMKKLNADIFATTDYRRMLRYRIPPSSISTFNNTINGFSQALTGEEIKRTGPYGKKGSPKAIRTFRYDVTPYGELKKDAANLLYTRGARGNITEETAR